MSFLIPESRDVVMTWFANRGQIIQLFVQVLALILAAIVAWPKLRGNEFLSLGSILFYILVGLVVFSIYRGVHRSTSSQDAAPLSTSPKLAITARSRFHANITYPLKLYLEVTNTEHDPVAIESRWFELSSSLRLAPNARPIPGSATKYRPRFLVWQTLTSDGKKEDHYEDRCILEPNRSIVTWVPIDPAIGDAALTAALNAGTVGVWHYRCAWFAERVVAVDYTDKIEG